MLLVYIIKYRRYNMKKPNFYFGEFKQYDKVFITAENGVDI